MNDVRTRTELSYSVRDRDSGDDTINVNISWEQGDTDTLRENLNRWLTAIGAPLAVHHVPMNDVDPD